MSQNALQEFIGRHAISAAVVPTLCAVLDEKAGRAPLDPPLSARMHEFLAAVGAGDVLEKVTPEEAEAVVAMLRTMYLADSKLLFASSRTNAWTHSDPDLLQGFGDGGRQHALAVARLVVPACEGLADRFRKEGASLLDVGVGVGKTAIAAAQMWPELRVVGIDPWQPSLRLARENVDRAGLAARIELREQGVETLADQDAYDFVWFALQFIPERCVRPGLSRALAALRPGGWIVSGALPSEGIPAPMRALLRMRFTAWGGPPWDTNELEGVLRESGYVNVRTIAPSGAPIAFVVGRRSP
jgi:SAM-dependent methyltransferase